MSRHGENIRKRKDGRWEAKYTFEGKRKAVYGKTQKEAKALLKQKLKEIEEALEKGCINYIEKSKVTLGQVARYMAWKAL